MRGSSGTAKNILRFIIPAIGLAVLASVIFVGPKGPDGTRSSPFDLKASILNTMTDEERSSFRSNPSIEREIAKRNFADPDLGRLILRH